MKLHGIPLVLTLVNLALLSLIWARGQKAEARQDLPVLRGRALQIVDDQGKVRASIGVFPVNPRFKTPDGNPYPETVLLRLITGDGRPSVKLAASTNGASLVLGGVSDPTHIQAIADRNETFLNMINKDGKKQMLKPGTRNGPTPYLPSR